ncbi:cupin domain-containing protein [Methylobacillus sp.]|uniref:cupin domain-containing protein n=1 Tax=Methylobacillus sp. TaxID=56818 RepID=UPI002FDF8051
MKVKHQAVKDQQPSMNVDGVAAWLGDTFVSADKDKTICAGFFHLGAGKPLDYTYDYEEMKIVVDGEFHLTEVNTGTKVVAKVGDVIYFADGDHIIFETPKGAIGFFCGQRQPL